MYPHSYTSMFLFLWFNSAFIYYKNNKGYIYNKVIMRINTGNTEYKYWQVLQMSLHKFYVNMG